MPGGAGGRRRPGFQISPQGTQRQYVDSLMNLLAVVSCVELQNGQEVGATPSVFTGSATDLVAQLLRMFGIEQHCGKHDGERVSHELLLDAGQPAQQSVGTDTRRARRRRDPRSPLATGL